MEKPPAPPEAVLIRLAREAAGIRVTDAAGRAGVSVARWSQVESGSETRNGQVNAVRAKAGTLARMAREVGVSADRLESEGLRPDAAEILREMEHQREAAVPSGPPAVSQLPLPPEGEPFDAEVLAALAPRATLILRRLDEVRRGRPGTPGIASPSGRQMFPDDRELALGWDAMRAAGFTPEKGLWYLAAAWAERELERQEEGRSRSGVTGA